MAYEKKTYNKPYKKFAKTEKAPAYKPKRGPNDGSGFTVQGEGLKYKQRRGPLSKLMSEEEKQKAGIHEFSYDFACRITRLFQYLTEDAEYKEFISSKQIYRSGTSIGANVRESKHAQSDADFLSKMSIAYKEADETDYWMNLLHDNGYLNDDQFESLSHDMQRILKLLTSIVKTMNAKVHPGSR